MGVLPPIRQQELAKVVSSICPAVVGYIFGSAATGQTNSESDIDIAILCEAPLAPVARWELQERLADALSKNVDLVDLLSASTVIQMQIVSRGELLFDNDPPRRHQFELYVYSSYAYLNEERKAILEEIKARGSVYDG